MKRVTLDMTDLNWEALVLRMYTLGDTTVGVQHSNKLIYRTKLNWLSPISLNPGSRLYTIG